MKRLMFIFIMIACTVAPARAADGVLPIEREFVTSPTECAAAWDSDGRLIFARCGNDPFMTTMTDDEIAAIPQDGTFTHNHPYPGCWTFSQPDVAFASRLQLHELRVVGFRDGAVRVAIMQRTGEIFEYVSDTTINNLAIQFTPETGDFDGCNALSAAWSSLAAHYGYEYTVLHD